MYQSLEQEKNIPTLHISRWPDHLKTKLKKKNLFFSSFNWSLHILTRYSIIWKMTSKWKCWWLKLLMQIVQFLQIEHFFPSQTLLCTYFWNFSLYPFSYINTLIKDYYRYWLLSYLLYLTFSFFESIPIANFSSYHFINWEMF